MTIETARGAASRVAQAGDRAARSPAPLRWRPGARRGVPRRAGGRAGLGATLVGVGLSAACLEVPPPPSSGVDASEPRDADPPPPDRPDLASCPAAPDLVAHWPLDDGAGDVAADVVGASDGMLQNLSPEVAWTSGQIGGALRFDGLDDEVRLVETPASDRDDDYTLSAWIRPDALDGARPILVRGQFSTADYNMQYRLDLVDGNLRLVEGDDVTADVDVFGAVPNAEWSFVACTVAAGAKRCFVDGEPSGPDATDDVGPFPSDTLILQMGRQKDLRHFAGTIDDVRIHARALDSAEIAAHYECGAAAGR